MGCVTYLEFMTGFPLTSMKVIHGNLPDPQRPMPCLVAPQTSMPSAVLEKAWHQAYVQWKVNIEASAADHRFWSPAQHIHTHFVTLCSLLYLCVFAKWILFPLDMISKTLTSVASQEAAQVPCNDTNGFPSDLWGLGTCLVLAVGRRLCCVEGRIGWCVFEMNYKPKLGRNAALNLEPTPQIAFS